MPITWKIGVVPETCWASFCGVDSLVGGSSCRVADFDLRKRVSDSTAVLSGQAVDNKKAYQTCWRSCSGSKDQRVILAGLLATLSAVLARRL